MATPFLDCHDDGGRAREGSRRVEHSDLLEDVLIAFVVVTTTLTALYVGRRSTTVQRGRPEGDHHSDAAHDERRPQTSVDAAAGGPATTWNRRLVSEHARLMRHGGTATVVALRVGSQRGPLARRSPPNLARNIATARAIARQSRASDILEVTPDGYIRILLVETTEDGARAYVDRLSSGVPAEHETGSRAIVAAWASMVPSRDLPAADRLAAARLRGARTRPATGSSPVVKGRSRASSTPWTSTSRRRAG
jgi:hypothetical protein